MVDINENVYNKSVVFHPDEIRSFIFILVPKLNPDNGQPYKINKFKSDTLGNLQIKWFNSMGDPGICTVGPFKYSGDTISKFEIEISQMKNQRMELTLEEP